VPDTTPDPAAREAARAVAEWAGTTEDSRDLHRFTPDRRARCNREIRTHSYNTTPDRDRVREPYARLRSREQIESDPLVAAGRVAYRFCPDCDPIPTAGLPAEAAAAVGRLNDLIDGKTPERPKPVPTETMTTEQLVLRLLTGRERLPVAEAERLLAELRGTDRAAVRTAAIREAADALDRIADDREQQAVEEYGHAYGMSNPTVASYRDMAAHVFRLATAPTTTPTPEEH
jgi:hypothetical protein